MASSDLAEMVSSDCSWAAELMRRRREMYSSYSPVFWRPAKGATSLHAGFLQRQIARDEVVGLRTGHGFVIGEPRRDEGFVDDFAVDDADRWDDDGRRALRAAWERLAARGASSLRVVSAKRDLPKNALLESLGLRLVQEWWVKPLTPSGHAETAGPVDEEGFSGHLGPAPPVYDPGGPVLLVRRIEPETSLDAMEWEASSWGAVLAVVAESAAGRRAEDLAAHGYGVASQWFLGIPVSNDA